MVGWEQDPVLPSVHERIPGGLVVVKWTACAWSCVRTKNSHALNRMGFKSVCSTWASAGSPHLQGKIDGFRFLPCLP